MGGKTFGKIAGIDVRGIIERKFYVFILIIERVKSLCCTKWLCDVIEQVRAVDTWCDDMIEPHDGFLEVGDVDFVFTFSHFLHKSTQL